MIKKESSNNRMSNGIGMAEILDINAPAAIVWRVLMDVESYPEVFCNTHSVENRSPKERSRRRKTLSPIEPGAKYLETRTIEGRSFEFDIAITVAEKKEKHSVFVMATRHNNSTGTPPTY